MYKALAEFEQERIRIIETLRALERSLDDLTQALSHEQVAIQSMTTDKRQALKSVCDAFTEIDLTMDGAPNQSPVFVAVVGVSAHTIALAERINAFKAALRTECAPLQQIRRRVPKRVGGTESIPVVRAILRSIQRSDLNLLAAYRKIPILATPPLSVAYTSARTRAVYRKSVDSIGDLLNQSESPAALRDREKLQSLPPDETHLAIVRGHYENIRANVVFDGSDPQGRSRVMIPAELPILYLMSASPAQPRVRFANAATDDGNEPRRSRESKLAREPWLESLPAYRYLQTKPLKR
jgi:hypothetical protein